MRYLRICLFSLLLSFGCDQAPSKSTSSATHAAQTATQTSTTGSVGEDSLGERIVIASGPLSELVFALGHQQRVVATDTSSVFPAEVEELPKIGFFRKLAPEPILAQEPSALLTTDQAGPDSALDRLEAAGLSVIRFPESKTFEEAYRRADELAGRLGTPERAAPLIERMKADLSAVEGAASEHGGTSALFIYARGPNVLMVAGEDTVAHTMLEIAGLKNAAGGIQGFKPMTPESVASASPDLLIMTKKGAESVGGWEGIHRLPGVAATPAGEARRLVTVDDLAFLSFGPRSAAELRALQQNVTGLLDGE